MRKSVFTVIPAALVLSLAACGDADTDAVDASTETSGIEVDVPDVPAHDVMVPVEPEPEATDDTMEDDSSADEAMETE